MERKEFTREEVLEVFNANDKVDIKFLKSGDIDRHMTATIKLDNIPEEFRPKGTGKAKKVNLQTLSVFDLKAGGWRSFRIDKLYFCKASK